MTRQIKKIRTQIIIPAISIIVLILTFAFLLLSKLQNENILRKNSFITQHLNSFIESETNEDANTFIGLVDIIKADLPIQKAWKNKNREELYSASFGLYNSLNQSHRITHFYFHDLTRTNFLRVHKPDRFGDNINRHTLTNAVNTQKTSFGIEIGTLGQVVLRVVSPWLIEDELMGYIEIGVEIEHILEKASIILDIESVTLINKDKLNQNEWELNSKKLGRRTSWDEYPDQVAVESSHIQKTEHYYPVIHHALTENTPGKIIKQDGNSFFTGNLPLIDVTGERVGFLVFFKDVTQDITSKNQSTLLLFIAGFVCSSILLTLYFFYIGRIERLQQRTFQQLNNEMQNRIKTEEKLREAKEIAENANNAKSIFLSQMSHELRTPMNAILGFSQLLELDDLNDEHRDYVNEILTAGHHLLHLINEILDLSKIESGNVDIDIQSLKPTSIIQECITLVRPLANQRNIKIVEPTDNNIYILADSGLLKQVLINLISNAIKYNYDHGLITISIKNAPTNYLRITVSDTGKGLNEDELSKVFQPFERLDAKNSTIEGSGVGLTICKHLMEKMNGTIGVNSTQGEGCNFWIELPIVT